MFTVSTALHHRPGWQPALRLLQQGMTLGGLEASQTGPAGAVHHREATKAAARGHHELSLPPSTV